MKEIKFRVWDGQQMHYPEIIGTGCDSFSWDKDRSSIHDCTQWDGEDGFVRNPVLMQYTGLKDRNGVEIYEGDVVNVPYITPDGNSTDTINYTASVVFKNGSFYITGYVEGIFYLLSNWCVRTGINYISKYGEVNILSENTHLTVIGNIHTKTSSNVQP